MKATSYLKKAARKENIQKTVRGLNSHKKSFI